MLSGRFTKTEMGFSGLAPLGVGSLDIDGEKFVNFTTDDGTCAK